MTRRILFLAFCLFLTTGAAFAQRARKTAPPKPVATPEQIIFAVSGEKDKTLEPIAIWRGGKLEATVGGDADDKTLNAFAKTYYRTGQKYRLVFGGGDAGLALVKTSLTATDCAKANASVTLQTKTQLNKLVMALAVNTSAKLPASVRRRPTPEEREAVSGPVRIEYGKHGVTLIALKGLTYTNLTALDLDRDGTFELVGSALVSGKGDDKRLLFFIAEQQNGKYALRQANYEQITPENLASGGDIKDIDGGLLNELLLDVYDVDGDGVAEVFTVKQTFEGNNYTIYRQVDGSWSEWFKGYNYHCAF
jgi:hypothetical protein